MLRSAIAAVGLLAAFTTSSLATAAGESPVNCARGWVFFDLGNTLVDTSGERIHYLPEARNYIRALREAGFHLGLISNVPDSWGPSVEAKLAHLKEEIASTWSEAEAFEWDAFELVLLPPSDADRKPAPFLFKQALTAAGTCATTYEGEDAREVRAAIGFGIAHGHVVGRVSASQTVSYTPIDKLFELKN